MTTKHLLSLDANPTGRDFVVGDIHGMFSAFDSLLDDVDFDPEYDRVISVGDLIDRGPESDRVLEYLSHPWFFSIMGNHEQMCLNSATDPHIHKNWIHNNGGSWWTEIDNRTQTEIRSAFYRLPTAAEVITDNGKIGIVHADISARSSWDSFTTKIETDKSLRDFAVWSRSHYDRYKAIGDKERIQGVKYVIVGHTPVSKCFDIGNIRYIDTGAPYTESKKLGTLTMMQIQPEIRIFQYNTRKKRKWVFAWSKITFCVMSLTMFNSSRTLYLFNNARFAGYLLSTPLSLLLPFWAS